MTDRNRQEVRQMLVEKRDALDLELSNKTKAVIASGTDGEVQRVVRDSAEEADQNTSDHIDFTLTQMKRQTLNGLNEAIRRFDEGTYGICSDCGEEIGVKRLEALPFASRCKDCEEKRENSNSRERKSGQFYPVNELA